MINQESRKAVVFSPETHRMLKKYAAHKGLYLYEMAELIVERYLEHYKENLNE